MKVSSRARVVGFGAAIVVFAGCSGAVGPHIDGIEVTLSLSDVEIAVGDSVEIRVLATNVTESQLVFFTGPCVLLVRFLDQSNTPVVTLPNTCNSINYQHTLGPGESLERVVLFDGAMPGPSLESPPLEPGTYRVLAGLSRNPDMDLINQSDAVALRILP